MTAAATPSFPSRLQASFAYHLAQGTWPQVAIEHFELTFASPTVDSPGRARRVARAALRQHLTGETLDDALLAITELVTNAVRHPVAGDADLSVTVDGALGCDCLRVEVGDGGVGFDPGSLSGLPRAEGGYGLVILDRVASRWGESEQHGHCVWFELDRPLPG
jgi:anti-sigma regulatory factor (Ser/Thr protein kinase)